MQTARRISRADRPGYPADRHGKLRRPFGHGGQSSFHRATKDEIIRAFDKTTGEILWDASLPAGGFATPATYAVGGRQFVVIACGGGKMGKNSHDAYVAFALPASPDLNSPL